MKAALIHHFRGIEKVEIEEVSIPSPKPFELQIAVKYAGVNPVDWKIAEGMLKTRMDYQFPIILGWDLSGIVSAVGKDVSGFSEGDPVFAYCRKKIIHDGSYAEYICLDAKNVVLKPKSLSFAQAAVIPLSSLTAWQTLFEAAHLKAKEKILIHAGAGGVGGFAIQFAKLAQAYVITTAGASNFDYVAMLGADEAIDYKKAPFIDLFRKKHPKGADVVFDTVGGSTLLASYAAAKIGGRLITIAGTIDQELASQRELETEFVFVRPDGKQLKKIASLFDEGKLSPPPIQEYSFDEVETALRASRGGHTRGKLVLNIAN
ncbi:MAG: NADP-dependent oxidoreductase [Chlamydiales bacterium]|nr:NADP-dependent oxidoreductase [Chlamydiales bacterium]